MERTDIIGALAGAAAALGKAVISPVRWAVNEALMPAAEKLIPQGSAELAHGLFSGGSAYVPYGPTESPMEKSQEPGTLAEMREEVKNEPQVGHTRERGLERE